MPEIPLVRPPLPGHNRYPSEVCGAEQWPEFAPPRDVAAEIFARANALAGRWAS